MTTCKNQAFQLTLKAEKLFAMGETRAYLFHPDADEYDCELVGITTSEHDAMGYENWAEIRKAEDVLEVVNLIRQFFNCNK